MKVWKRLKGDKPLQQEEKFQALRNQKRRSNGRWDMRIKNQVRPSVTVSGADNIEVLALWAYFDGLPFATKLGNILAAWAKQNRKEVEEICDRQAQRRGISIQHMVYLALQAMDMVEEEEQETGIYLELGIDTVGKITAAARDLNMSVEEYIKGYLPSRVTQESDNVSVSAIKTGSKS